MKKQMERIIFFLFTLSVVMYGCKKEEGLKTVITGTNLSSPKPGTLVGTFTATGGINTTGTHVMIVKPISADSIHCNWTMTAREGTFVMIQDCSRSNMTGNWYIQSGTGAYAFLNGKGTLTMMFPPNVPAGILGIETNTGTVWFHP